jgi:perosamine synthetase
VATNAGTTALHLATATLKLKPGDEVLVSAFTNMASFFAVLYTGATPIPIDSEPDTWNIDPKLIEAKITPRTKAIMVVHIYGHPVDMDPVMEIAKKHNLMVIEDAAEAHGAEYKGRRVGGIGDIGCFSFYANKIITTGEGGMVVTNNKEYAERAWMLKSLAFGFGTDNKFIHHDIGFNYRMPNLQAAIGLAQLEKIDFLIEKKRELAAYYNEHLKDIPELQLPVEKPYAKNVYWVYHVVLQGALAGRRSEVFAEMEKREAFMPYNVQKESITKGLAKPGDCPVAENIGANGFYLPSGPILSDEEKEYVVVNFREVLRSLGAKA